MIRGKVQHPRGLGSRGKSSEERSGSDVAFLCRRLRLFCRSHFCPGKMRDKKNRSYSGHSGPDRGHTGLFVGHRTDGRFGRSAFGCQREDLFVSHPVRRGHRGILALLLPGAAGGPGQYRGPCGQAERPCHSRIFLFCLWGEAEPQVRSRARPPDSGNRGHGFAVIRGERSL